MVLMYIESGDVLNGPGNDVPLDNTVGLASGNVVHSYLVSGVLSISIYRENDKVDAQVMYSLPIVPLNDSSEYEAKYDCVFFDLLPSKWSTRGCHVRNVTERFVRCFCSHLTSFSVLMQISKNELRKDDEVINTWITIVGLSLSIVTLSINLLIYLLLRNKLNMRYKIHINLIICTLGVDILFLSVLNQINRKVLCKTVSILLHYLVLCMFMWMLAEAIFLVLKVVYNKSKRFKLVHYMLFCYVTPAFIVAMVITFNHECYVTDTVCWLKVSCRLVVVIPACLIIGINILVLGKMVHVIYKRSGSIVTKPPKKQNEYKQLRNAVRGSFVLLPILGVTWIIGVLNIDSTTSVMVYLFNILNSLQGIFLFVVCCLLDNQIMDPLMKLIAKHTPGKNRVNISNQEENVIRRTDAFITGHV
ncbi:adhesion G protein-coupled receptor L4-like [Antedon mediterranea]|uniref:adhesion G protein-coupled receptor L4-like n=1 Tax=Antedon mediterranea TaxID=105859 RepID=UPI003AF586FA